MTTPAEVILIRASIPRFGMGKRSGIVRCGALEALTSRWSWRLTYFAPTIWCVAAAFLNRFNCRIQVDDYKLLTTTYFNSPLSSQLLEEPVPYDSSHQKWFIARSPRRPCRD